MSNMRLIIIAVAMFYAHTMLLGMLGINHKAYGQHLGQIQDLFRAKRYEEASQYLKMYLKTNSNNVKAWEMLGVSQYYLGNSKQALKFLKYVESRSPEVAYNHLFQGLSYMSLKENALAANYLKRSALGGSGVNSRKASFELAVWYYNRRKAIRAKRWIDHYLTNYPQGKNVKLLKQAKKNLEMGVFRGTFRGIAKPDMEKSFFRNHPLSLWGSPHYWFLDTGGKYVFQAGAKKLGIDNPTESGDSQQVTKIYARDQQLFVMNFDTGIGLGPYKGYGLSFLTGYHYRQRWNTTHERLVVFFDDVLDINYFLFRPDLLVRSHQSVTRLEYDIYEGVTLGMFILGEYKRMGSSLIAGPESWSISDSFLVSMSGSATPWLGYRWSPRHLIKAYLYIVREINELSPDFSFQTLDPSTYLPFAFGLRYEGEFPKWDLGFDLELHSYDYVYNDPYLDHRHMGADIRMSYSIISALQLYFGGTYDLKDYVERYVKTGECDAITQEEGQVAANGDKISTCARNDNFWSVYGGVDFVYRENYSFFLKGSFTSYSAYVNRKDDLPRVHSFDRQEYLGGIKIAFPNVKTSRDYEDLHSNKKFLEAIDQ